MQNKIINTQDIKHVEKIEVIPAGEKMTITLKTGYISAGRDAEFKKFIDANKGKTFEVDTKHLFKNQYNLLNLPYRIFDTHIQKVTNDKRFNRNYCHYCGKQWDRIKDVKPCACDDKYIHTLDDAKTNFFINERAVEILNNVYSLDDLREQLEDVKYIKYSPRFKNEILINNYELTSYPGDCLGYYRIRNSRKCINFLYDDIEKVYYINNGIGYKKVKCLDIPAVIQNKLNKIMGAIFSAAKKEA